MISLKTSIYFGSAQPHYCLAFTGSCGNRQSIERNETLFNAFDRFESDDISYMNKADRHDARSAQTEISLNKRAAVPQAA